MARKGRVEYAGAVYHVMSRGNGDEDIFYSDAQKRRQTKYRNTLISSPGSVSQNESFLLPDLRRGQSPKTRVFYCPTFKRRLDSGMARKGRVEYEGAVYHVMSRGNGGEDIFKTDKDREMFLKVLGLCCEREGWKIHSYVLMRNHYHLLLETPRGNLIEGMKWFLGTYTKRFNVIHDRWGHLFQGRYKAILIDGDDPDYFKTVSTYIHLNPIRAGLIPPKQKLESFLWSSAPLFAQPPKKRFEWLTVSRVLENAGFLDSTRGRKSYLEYLALRADEERGLSEEDLQERYRELRRGWVLGNKEFRTAMLEKMDEAKGSAPYEADREVRTDHEAYKAEKIFNAGLVFFDLDAEKLSAMRKKANEKRIIGYFIRHHSGVPLSWIAEHLKMGHVSNVTTWCNSIEDLLKDRSMKKRITAFEKTLVLGD